MKKDLILIPGAYTLRSRSKIAKKIYKVINFIIGIHPHTDKPYKNLINLLKDDYHKIYFIDYKRRLFSLGNKYNTVYLLDNIAKTRKNYDVLAFSFGGYLVQKVLNKTKKYPKKIVLVDSLNLDKEYVFPKSVEVINIQSRRDFFIKQMIFFLSATKGNQLLYNARNIYLEDLTHTELETGKKVKKGNYKGLSSFQLIRRILKG